MNELNTLIENSPLADFEKQILRDVFDSLDEEMKSALVALSEEQPWLIPYFYVNYAAKRYALEKNDKGLLRKVVRAQEETLESII